MKMKWRSGLLALGLVALVGMFAVNGCSVTATTSTPSLDPGRIGSSEVTISGGATYNSSTGIVDINLNAILISTDEAATITTGSLGIYVGTDLSAIAEWGSVDITIPTLDDRPMDIVFVLDNTGSIAGRIQAIKDSISAFAATLEAAGLDARFGVISFGDTTTESESLDLPATAEAVATWLTALSGVGGGDGPENGLDAVMKAYDDFSWRTGTQKVFVLIIDTVCHQLGDGTTFTDRTVASVEAALSGIASVYAVSPIMDVTNSFGNDPGGYSGTGDVRWLADGYGYFSGVSDETYATSRPYSGTGGLWVELPASGNIDLTTLGISSLLASGVTIRFDYTFTAGTWYIHVLVDTNGDGTFDSDLMITIVISGSSGVSVSSELKEIKGIPGPAIN